MYDEAYPHLETPRLLLNRDPVVSDLFRQELKKYNPTLYSWKWLDGIELGIGEGKEDEFADPIWYHINQYYKIGTGRIRASIERSYCVNYVSLGNGYRLHCTGYNPIKNERDNKHCFILEWLFLKKSWEGPVKHDGTKRLRQFLEHLSQAPNNPYRVVLFHTMGADLLDQYGRHLMATSYRPTGATTKELEKLYGYRLKAKATKQFSADGHDVFYRADCYRPASPRYTKEQFPYKEVLKDRR